MTDATFAPEVVAAVCRHMNDDHRADAVLICRQLAGLPDAVDAETTDVDAHGMSFAVRDADGTTRAAYVPFALPVRERAQVRAAVIDLYDRACSAAGLAGS